MIFYLDNKTQELESSNQELKKRCEQLQVSLELLNNANTHKVIVCPYPSLNTTSPQENQLTVELTLLKDKYETNETKLRSHKVPFPFS